MERMIITQLRGILGEDLREMFYPDPMQRERVLRLVDAILDLGPPAAEFEIRDVGLYEGGERDSLQAVLDEIEQERDVEVIAEMVGAGPDEKIETETFEFPAPSLHVSVETGGAPLELYFDQTHVHTTGGWPTLKGVEFDDVWGDGYHKRYRVA